jgi:hypothetical protein
MKFLNKKTKNYLAKLNNFCNLVKNKFITWIKCAKFWQTKWVLRMKIYISAIRNSFTQRRSKHYLRVVVNTEKWWTKIRLINCVVLRVVKAYLNFYSDYICVLYRDIRSLHLYFKVVCYDYTLILIVGKRRIVFVYHLELDWCFEPFLPHCFSISNQVLLTKLH